MDTEPLPQVWKIRIWVVVGSSAVLVLLGLPLLLMAAAHGDGKGVALGLALVVGIPVVFGTLMWFQVRRYRRNPQFRRRQPNAAASRTLMIGNLVVLLVVFPLPALFGLDGWQRLVATLVLGLPATFVVYRLAKRHDPRLHWWRRPDPLPDGQEPDHAPTPKPW